MGQRLDQGSIIPVVFPNTKRKTGPGEVGAIVDKQLEERLGLGFVMATLFCLYHVQTTATVCLHAYKYIEVRMRRWKSMMLLLFQRAVVQDIHMVPDKVPWALRALGFQVLGTHICGSETSEASKLGDTGFILEHSLMPTPLIQVHQWWRSMTACTQHSGQSRVEDLRWRGSRPPSRRGETNISTPSEPVRLE